MLLDKLFTEYASSHQDKRNILTHFIGIPLIIYALFVFLSQLPIVGLFTLAEVLLIGASSFYFAMDWKLATPMLGVSVILDVLARLTPFWWIGLIAFIAGWALQLIGHSVFEHKSPSFLNNLIHLLVGPLFILNEVLKVHAIKELEDVQKDSDSDRPNRA